MEIGVKHEWVESFCVEVQGKAEFDAVWKVLKKEFPASSREAETLYNPNSFTGKGTSSGALSMVLCGLPLLKLGVSLCTRSI